MVPTFLFTSGACLDKALTEKCEVWAAGGKCDRPFFKDRCAKTCGECK